MVTDEGIRKAFEGVKRDMLEVKNNLLVIAERQEKLEAVMEESGKKVSKAKNPVKKKSKK